MYRDFSKLPIDTVNIQSRPETLDWYNLSYNGDIVIAKGVLVVEDATTKRARLAIATDTYAWLNWTPSDMATVLSYADDKFDTTGLSPTVAIPAGGITALNGRGTIVNMAITLFDTAITGVTPVANYPVIAGANGQPAAVAVAAGGVWVIGKILRVDGTTVTWTFTSDGHYHV